MGQLVGSDPHIRQFIGDVTFKMCLARQSPLQQRPGLRPPCRKIGDFRRRLGIGWIHRKQPQSVAHVSQLGDGLASPCQFQPELAWQVLGGQGIQTAHDRKDEVADVVAKPCGQSPQ